MSKALRYLRIAFSATCVIVAVLFVVLWVRSYRTHDVLYFHFPFTDIFGVDSRIGTVHIASGKLPSQPPSGFSSEHFKTSEQMAQLYGIETDPFNERPNRLGVGFTHPFGLTVFSSPTWMLAVFAVVVAILPWLRYFPRRFSLRTLLIATTLVAVVLGMTVYLLR